MRFAPEHLETFARLSGDRSPLHMDAGYAGRTSFGRQVVHGMAAVLVGIGTWRRAQPTRLARVRCTFRKPLHLDTEYELRVREAPERTVLSWLHDGVSQCDVVIHLAAAPAEATSWPTRRSPLRATARDDGGTDVPSSFAYDIDAPPDVVAALRLESLLADQVTTLAGLSYIVGMETPGTQALFATLDVTFGESKGGDSGPFFRDVRTAFDRRYQRLQLDGATGSGATFSVGAFVRPRPVDVAIDTIAAAMRSRELFAGRRVVVTGASRGLGAAIAKAFAVCGADVVVHYKSQRESASLVAEEIRRYRGATLVEADLGTDEGAEHFAASVVEGGRAPDVIVLNATLPIEARPARSFTTTALTSFVARSVAMVHGPCRNLLPRLGAGAAVVVISSVYAVERPAEFAHYVAAKLAIEGLVAVMAKEHPAVRFVIARPPRMLTDQTNTVGIDPASLPGAGDVAVRLLERLREGAAVIDL